MRKISFTVLCLFIGFLGFAQSTFEKYASKEQVNAVLVTKKMFELMGKVKADNSDTPTQKYLELTKKIDELRVLSTADKYIK